MWLFVQSSPLQQSPVYAAHRHDRNRTSLDLELDLQAHKMQHAQLTDEIMSLKEFQKRVEDAKAEGNCVCHMCNVM